MKRILLTAALLLTVGCSRPAEVEPLVDLTSYYSGTPQVFAARQPGWKIGVLEPRDEGRDLTVDEFITHEAVDRWVVIPVVIQNATGKRQKLHEALELDLFSTLVGSDDKLYEVDSSSMWYGDDDSAPLDAGESVRMLLMFDVPADVQPKQLLTNTYDTSSSVQIDL